MIYKELYLSLFRSVAKLGGSNYHLRTNVILSAILTSIFASILSIYIKVTGNQINFPDLYIVLFITACLVGNFFLFRRTDRKNLVSAEKEQEQKKSWIGRITAMIAIVIAISASTIAFVI